MEKKDPLEEVADKVFVSSINKEATNKEIEEIFSPYGHVEHIFFKSTHGWSLILSCYVFHTISVALRNGLVFDSVFYFLSNISIIRKEVVDRARIINRRDSVRQWVKMNSFSFCQISLN
ncbi:hypothetical protein JHK84_054866 [Glycine max]|nr:hypothetical protein JHK84_054866 [Glycine max]